MQAGYVWIAHSRRGAISFSNLTQPSIVLLLLKLPENHIRLKVVLAPETLPLADLRASHIPSEWAELAAGSTEVYSLCENRQLHFHLTVRRIMTRTVLSLSLKLAIFPFHCPRERKTFDVVCPSHPRGEKKPQAAGTAAGASHSNRDCDLSIIESS